jgi:two-component system chemotaxis sensor kinase CheA
VHAALQNETFAREAEDLLEQIETTALALEETPTDVDGIHLLFRVFHTLKGSSAMVGLTAIAGFTHHVESTLELVRSARMGVSPVLISAILAAKDHVHYMLGCAAQGEEPSAELGAAIVARFTALSNVARASLAASAQADAPRMRTTYLVSFRIKRELEGMSVEPSALLESLRAMGSCDARRVSGSDEGFHDGWEVTLTTTEDEDALRDVFIFAPEGSELSIEQGMAEFVTEPPQAAPPAPSPQPAAASAAKAAQPGAAQSRGDASRNDARKQDTVRVASDRLDKLVKLVGELVINQSRLQQAHAHDGGAELAGPVESMERLIAELRDSVFGMRMMPIGPTFARFKRLVRDLSEQLGKEIELHTEGEDTELDKTVLDQLGDPLVHLVRNSLDHGIELPAERIAKGKPAKGRLLLSAAHESGHVVITIRDDGKGLDRALIRAKAEEKGLIDPGAHLSEQETLELIMRPGFSTAQAVTQLSGRGVGMDVVKKTVESLRGTLSIASTLNQGTTMRLTLPLTLAIIDGLLVEVEGDHFIVPLAAVTENVELYRADRLANNGRHAVAVRGELIPYVRLRELFGSRSTDTHDIEKVVLVSLEGQRLGLVVDKVVGSHQTVIQPLGPFYRDVEMFSGTTIMGDGRVVMILDLAGVLRRAERTTPTRLAS